ncbi:MAG: DNA mismatch repair endonuclease MutL, partial [Lachnospiraceae bacterium]|nr:DNA mismatch repair endonuclease MutL [Lachnospiraceae bacterium]
MREIRELDQVTVDKIAAGEVVERPAGAVKELVENALDSGATLITIEIENGGIGMIRVTDNGSGIPAGEISKAFTRHATSKIRTIEDLSSLDSLGFRGEALSSIAAVSRAEMITKTADTITGTRYVIEGGVEVLCEETGAPEGTTVIVHDLFYNTPARAKFLKTPKTEGSYVAELAERFALAHPECAFNFISDKKDRFHTSGNGDLKENIYRIYGRDVSANVVQTEFSDERMKVTGYLGKPVINRANRSQELFFVNGRNVRDKMLSAAVEEGYRGFLMQHRFPFVILNIDISPDEIDVNVHPTKMEIRFNRPRDIAGLVIRSLRDSLMGLELIPDTLSDGSSEVDITQSDDAHTGLLQTPFRSRGVPVHNAGRQPFKLVYDTEPAAEKSVIPRQETLDLHFEEPRETYNTSEPDNAAVTAGREILTPGGRRDIRVIGQLFDTFWIMQWQDKLLIMDQHAAHEKVNYERMMKRYHDKSV